MGRVAAEGMADTGSILLGRRTYEDFHSYWPHQTDNPFTTVLDNTMRLFPDGSPFAALRLVDSVTTTKGVVIATYQPAEPAALETMST